MAGKVKARARAVNSIDHVIQAAAVLAFARVLGVRFVVISHDTVGDTDRRNRGVTIFLICRHNMSMSGAGVSTLFVVNSEASAALGHLHGVRIHAGRVLDLRSKNLSRRKGDGRNVFHGIQERSQSDNRRAVRNEKEIHDAELRKEPR